MSTSILTRLWANLRKRPIGIWLILMLVVSMALPAWAGSKAKDDETLKNAANVNGKMFCAVVSDSACPVSRWALVRAI